MFLSLIFNVFWFVLVQSEKIVPLVFTVCDKLARKLGRAFILCVPNLTHSLTGQFPLKAENTRWRKIFTQHLSILNLAGTRHSTQFYLVDSLTPILDLCFVDHMPFELFFLLKENCSRTSLIVGLSQETEKQVRTLWVKWLDVIVCLVPCSFGGRILLYSMTSSLSTFTTVVKVFVWNWLCWRMELRGLENWWRHCFIGMKRRE